MSREEAENVRLWLFVEDRLAEDEASRVEALSDEELGEELRRAAASERSHQRNRRNTPSEDP